MGTNPEAPRPPRRREFLILTAALGVIAAAAFAVPTLRDRTDASPPSRSTAGAPRTNSSSSSPSQTPSSSEHPRNVWAGVAPTNMSAAVAGITQRVYVPNGKQGTVEVIDPKTFKIIRRFPVGSFPEHVTPSWDLKHLYVDVSASSRLVVIDPKTGRPTGQRIHVPHPYNLYFTPDGSKAIAVVEYYNRLEFRDPTSFHLIKQLPVPCSGPDHMDFSADGTYLLISCEFDGNVLKIDDRTMKVVGRVNVGGSPVDVKVAPNGRVFYVANQRLSGVFVIEPKHMRIVKFIPTGTGAHGFAISRDTKSLYVTNRLAGTISVIDFATKKVTATWNVGGSPDMVQVTTDGNELWVSNRYSGTVTVVSTRSGRVLHTIRVGVDPHGLCLFPQPGTYSIGHNGVYR